MSKGLDPRLHPYRSDLAAAHLEGRVEAARFVAGVEAYVAEPSAPVHGAPRRDGEMTSEALFGEAVTVYEEHEGWAWVQLRDDGYVGYVPANALKPGTFAATHRICVPRTFLFPEPDIKSIPMTSLPFSASVAGTMGEGDFMAVKGGGFIYAKHVRPLDHMADDWVAVAESFLGAPYLWGGKTIAGLDCSGLVQVSARAAGHDVPRDSDMMRENFGAALPGDHDGLARGDVVFWKGHVGIMRDAETLLHANAHHLLCVSEPLGDAVKRIEPAAGQVLQINRPAGVPA